VKIALPPVSIGISFFNAEETLLDAVRSVFAQTHQDWELILIDDGSTDRSLELVRSIKDPRVKVYSDGKNRRLAARLNEIVDLSTHDFIGRMDADDLMARDRIEKQLLALVSDPLCDLVSTGVVSLTDDNKPVGVRSPRPLHAVTPRSLLLSHHGIVHASIIARKDWYIRNRYREDLPVAQDMSLWISAYAKGDLGVKFISEPLYFYREDSSVTPEKLLKAYSVGRSIMLSDTKHGFPLYEKLFAYSRCQVQSFLVKVLKSLGKMDLIRARRSAYSLSEIEFMHYESEISLIRATELPVISN